MKEYYTVEIAESLFKDFEKAIQSQLKANASVGWRLHTALHIPPSYFNQDRNNTRGTVLLILEKDK